MTFSLFPEAMSQSAIFPRLVAVASTLPREMAMEVTELVCSSSGNLFVHLEARVGQQPVHG